MNLHKILTEKLPLEAVYSDSEDDKDLEFLKLLPGLYASNRAAFRCLQRYFNGHVFNANAQRIQSEMSATQTNKELIRQRLFR